MPRQPIEMPEKKELQRLYDKYGYRYVCHIYGISESLFYKWSKHYNLNRHTFKYGISDEEFTKVFTNTDISINDMIDMWKIGEQSIRARASKLKIKRKGYKIPIIVTYSDGTERSFESMGEASRELNVTMDILRHLVRNPNREYRGYNVRKVEE